MVHGFDLDCCGILWDGSYEYKDYKVPALWATERAIYANKHKVNWFDPERASPSYAYRLRGYEIMLPMFDKDIVDQGSVPDDAEGYHLIIRG